MAGGRTAERMADRPVRRRLQSLTQSTVPVCRKSAAANWLVDERHGRWRVACRDWDRWSPTVGEALAESTAVRPPFNYGCVDGPRVPRSSPGGRRRGARAEHSKVGRFTKTIENAIRPQIRRDYPLNLSISVSGGKENNSDSPSNGE